MIRGLIAVLALVAWPTLAQDQPMPVVVDPVRTEPLSQTMPVLGRIVTRQQGPVAARVPGRVQEVEVEVGDRIAKGDPLVRLDNRTLTHERELAQAEYEAVLAEERTAEEQLDLLQGELDRIAQLKESAAFSRAQLVDKQNEIEVAESRIAAARARLGQYQAKLAIAAQDLEDSVVRAPFPGVVSMRHVSPGAYLGVGDPVVTLIDDSELEIEADVPSDRLSGLTPGTVVPVILDDRTRHEAVVRAVVPEENPLTRTRAVRFMPRFGETSKPLAVAQSVTVELPIGEPREVVTVNKDAVIQQSNGAVVYLVDEEKAEVRPVQLGEAVGGRFEVLGGLQPGDLVVVRGNERLRPGQAVTYSNGPGPAPGGAADTDS